MSSRQLLLVILLFTWLKVASGNPVVQKLHTNVTGKDGDTVPLPCSTENKTNISRDIIQWYKGPKTKENKPIHKYVPRDRPPQTPRDDFINLTSLSEKGLLSGDCSLNLTVNTSHNDTYYCYVAGRLLCTVTLKVLPKGKNNSSMYQDVTVSSVNSLNGTDGLTTTQIVVVVAAAALPLIGIICGVYCCKRRKGRKRNRSGPNSNNPQTHPGVSYHQARQPPLKMKRKNSGPHQIEEPFLRDVIVDQCAPADGNMHSRNHCSAEI